MKTTKTYQKKLRRNMRRGGMIVLGVLLTLGIVRLETIADTNLTFVQTDWSAGASGSNAIHPTNQSGWNQYTSKDGNLSTATPGQAKLATQTFTLEDDTDSNFGAGTLSDVVVNGTGTSATLDLVANATDPFDTTLGHWQSLPAVPKMSGNTAYALVKDDPNPGDIFVYAIWGTVGNRTAFAKWDHANSDWVFLADFPGATTTGYPSGTSLAYPGSGDVIHALRGSGTREYYQYTISTDTWTKKGDVPCDVLNGGSIVAPDESTVMITCGNYSSNIYKYISAGDIWAQLNSAPWTVFASGSLMYPETGDFVYLIRGYNSRNIARYSLSSNVWTSLTDAPYNFYYNASLNYPGSGDHLYGQDQTQRFMRYNVTTDTWQSSPTDFADLPVRNDWSAYGKGFFYHDPNGGTPKIRWLMPGRYTGTFSFDLGSDKWDDLVSHNEIWNTYWGSEMAYDGVDYIYWVRGWNNTMFKRYSISQNAWEDLPNSTIPFDHYGAGIIFYNGKIYGRSGNTDTTNNFAVYDPATTTWTTLADLPAGLHWGGSAAGANDGGTDYIYMMRGWNTNTFWRYDIDFDTWETMANSPSTMYTGGHMVYPGSGDYIYVARGNGSRTFYQYSISGDSWATLSNIPSVLNGLNQQDRLVHRPGTNEIYWMRGTDSSSYAPFDMARYDISTDTWTTLDNMPFGRISSFAATNTHLYATTYGERGFYRYDFTTGLWDDTAIDSGSSLYYVDPVLGPDNDTMYYIGGYHGRNTIGWKYSISQKKWLDFFAAPFNTYEGLSVTYPGTGNYIYAIPGDYSQTLWRLDTTNETWTPMSDIPYRPGRGADIHSEGSDLYLKVGYFSTSKFLHYNIQFDIWNTLTDTPAAAGSSYNGKTLAVAPGNYVYLLRAENSKEFWRFNKSTLVWDAMEDVPVNFGSWSALYYPGTGDDLYAASGANELFRYSISGNSWSQLADIPYQSAGFSFAYPGSGDVLYANSGNWKTDLQRYSISEDIWDQPRTFPTTPGYSNDMVALDTDDVIFWRRGGGGSDFYKYTIADRKWTTVTAQPNGSSSWSARMTTDGEDFIYALDQHGQVAFWKYDVLNDNWVTLANMPGTVQYGTDIIYKNGKVYAIRGGNTTAFYRYNPLTDDWDTMATTPANMYYGARLVPGDGNYIYASRGGGNRDFYRYDITGDTWSSMAFLPTVYGRNGNDPGAMVYPGFGDFIYFSPGTSWSTREMENAAFYRYSVSGDSWEEVKNLPYPASSNFAFVHPNRGRYFYGYSGYNETYEFWRYLAFSKGEFTSRVIEVGNNAGFGDVSWTDNSLGSLEIQVRSANSPTMVGATDWQTADRVNNNTDLSNYTSVKDGDRYLQYRVRFIADDVAQLPSLDKISFDYEIYPVKQELISSAFNSTEATNRVMKLKWTEGQPAGTDIRFQTRTAPDDAGSPGTWGPWLGPEGTQAFTNNYSSAVNYAFAPEVEVVSDVARLKKILEDYTYTQRVILDNSAGTADKANAVITLVLDETNPSFWAGVNSDGSDVRFTDELGNLIEFNLDGSGAYFDYANKDALIYVKIPFMAASQETSIFMKYGKVGATSASNPNLRPFLLFGSGGVVDASQYDFITGRVALIGDNEVQMQNAHWGWGQHYFAAKEEFARQEGRTFYHRFKHTNNSSNHTMIGWKNTSGSYHYNQIVYAFYWNNGSINIYENGGHIGGFGSYTKEVWYDAKITLKAGGGATYAYRPTGTTTWNVIRDTTNLTDATLRPSVDHYSGGGRYFNTKDWMISGDGASYQEGGGGGGAANGFPIHFFSLQEDATSPSLSGWDKRIPIIVDNSAGGAHTNLQVTLDLNVSQGDFWNNVRSDGHDIRFVDADNTTILNYWRETFNYSGKIAKLRVKLDQLAAGEQRNLYLYYNRSDASDASSFDVTMTNNFAEADRNHSGVSLDGVGDQLTVTQDATLDLTSAVTLEAQVKYLADNWLPGYGYRKSVTLDNTGNPAKTNTSLGINIPFEAGKMNADYSDLRFVDLDGTQLSHKRSDYDGSDADFIVKGFDLPDNATKDIYMYYGNTNATDQSDESLLAGVAAPGAIAAWGFEDGAGSSLTDISGNGHHGSLQGGATWEPTGGKFGGGIRFNGTSSYIDISTVKNDLPTAAFTMMGWVKADAHHPSSWSLLVGGADNHRIYYNSNGHFYNYLKINGSWRTPNASMGAVGTWYHLASTYDGTNLRSYINGTLVGTWSYPGAISAAGAEGMWIGAHVGSSTYYVNGVIDEVALFDRMLSDSEVSDLYTNGFEVEIVTPVFGSEETPPAIDQTIVSKSGAYELKFDGNGLTATVNATSVSTPNYTSPGWVHYAMSYDGADIKIYIDGTEVATTALTDAITTNANNVLVGSNFNGALDEIRMWDIARSAGDIKTEKLAKADPSDSNLVMYLACNENAGISCSDITANSNDGSLDGSTGWEVRPFAYTNEEPGAFYHLDAGAGSLATDDSGNGNTLTLVNSVWFAEDLPGFAGGFSTNLNGIDAFLQANDASTLDLTNAVSLEAWVKIQSTTGTQTIIDKGNDQENRRNYGLILENGKVSFSYMESSVERKHTSSATLLPLTTYHIAATYDDLTDEAKVYVNGQLDSISTLGGNLETNNDLLYIGKSFTGNFTNGQIDGVRIYNRVLPDEEVFAHFENRLYNAFPTVQQFDYEPDVDITIGAYAKNNPVVQPVVGVFYENSNLAEFAEIANKPSGTEIRYQVSRDGFKWYWHTGASWQQISGGYSQTNLASEINTHLVNFQNTIGSSGDLYYRAYLHSDQTSFNTPSLDQIQITLVSGESFYIDPDGSVAINTTNTDAMNDQWMQYRVILFSDGQNTPVLQDVTTEYLDAFIDVLTPDGGEVVNANQSYDITWDSQAINGGAGTVKIDYSADNGNTYNGVVTGEANDGSYSWTVPEDPTQQAFVRISSEQYPNVINTSAASFRILSLGISSPNGGEVWEVGKSHQITWSSPGMASDNLTLEYSVDGGSTWVTIATQRPNTGFYNWTIPSLSENDVIVRVFDADNVNIEDASDASFAIVPVPTINVSTPGTGVLWGYGTQQTISWQTNQSQLSNTVRLEYSRDSFSSDIQVITTGVSVGTPQGPEINDDIIGTFDWTIPDAVSNTVKVRVIEEVVPPGRDTQSAVGGLSATFAITEPTITITSPTGADNWVMDDVNDITWTTEGTISNNLSLEYTIDAGTNWVSISTGETNDGTYSWTVPSGAVGSSVAIRMTDGDRVQVQDLSDNFVVLGAAEINVLTPNGGENLTIGDTFDITWNSNGNKLQSGGADYLAISLYYSDDNGGTWNLISDQQANDGVYTWTVADAETTQALIKVEDGNDTGIFDESDAVYSILQPTVTITSPNGGELWYATGSYSLTWTSVGSVSDNLRIEYSNNNGSTWNVIGAGEANDGSFGWSIADDETTSALIRMTDMSRPVVTDTSDAVYTVTAPSLTVTAPNGGEFWVVGTQEDITWTHVGDHTSVRDNLTIQYSTNGGANWSNVVTGEANDGIFNWTIPNDISQSSRVRVFDSTRPATTDDTDADFDIAPPTVDVLTPNGGELWPVGGTKQITWNSFGQVSDSLTIEYSTDGFSTVNTIATNEANDGTYDWVVADDVASTVSVRVRDTQDPYATDASDVTFAIVHPLITITDPNGGGAYIVGDSLNIIWTTDGSVSDNLKFEYSKDNFASDVHLIADNVSNTGNFLWASIADDVSTTVRVRITDNLRTQSSDKSDSNFTILPIPQLTIDTPNGGEAWKIGTAQEITWHDNSGPVSNSLDIDYSTDSGSTWTNIATGEPNDGAFTWVVADDLSATARVRITDSTRPVNNDQSDSDFDIAAPTVTITSPNGAEKWAVGDFAPVTWTSEGAVSNNLLFEYSKDNFASDVNQITVGQTNDGTYTWTVPDDPTAEVYFRITDGSRPITSDTSDASFAIIPVPTIAITQPNGGEDYVIGDTMPIRWTWEGLSVSNNLLIEASGDNFATSSTVGAGVSNTGSFDWIIGQTAPATTNVRVRITDSTRPVITDVSDAPLRIRGGFNITSPALNETYAVNEPKTVTWNTQGVIPYVNLQYSKDNFVSDVNTIASNLQNTGTFIWTVPEDLSNTVKVRISDVADTTIRDDSEEFEIRYYTITWQVFDFDTLTHLQNLSTRDSKSGINVLDFSVESPVTYQYKYGVYTTFWSKEGYIERSLDWIANADKTVTIQIESTISAQVEWRVIINSMYHAANDSLSIDSWLERRGKFVGGNPIELAELYDADYEIYDGDTLVHTISLTAPGGNGIYSDTWANTGLDANKSYVIKGTIKYREAFYSSAAGLDVLSQATSQAIKDNLDVVATLATDIQDTVIDKAQEVADKLEESVDKTEKALDEQLVKLETTRKEISTVVNSEILNRENQVRRGQSMVIRYRTLEGSAPLLDVHDPKGNKVLSGRILKPIATAPTIYESEVRFENSWGLGDFTVVASDPTNKTLDSMTITVISTDLGDIAGRVSSLTSITSVAPQLKNATTQLNAQIELIDRAISGLSARLKDSVEEIKKQDLGPIFNSLKKVSDEIKKLGGTEGFGIDDLIELSKDSQASVKSIRSDAQRMKAMVEVNNRLLTRDNELPVMQEWIELGSLVFKSLAVNPSAYNAQKVLMKIYLPKECKPKDLLDLGDLEVAYDVEKELHYAYKEFTLEPKQSILREVRVEDIWVIDESEFSRIRKAAENAADQLLGSEFALDAKQINTTIQDKIIEMEDVQEAMMYASPDKHISTYRRNMNTLDEVLKDLDILENMISQVSGGTESIKLNQIWKVILFVMVFLGLMCFICFVVWQQQTKRAAQQMVQELDATPAADPFADAMGNDDKSKPDSLGEPPGKEDKAA